MYDVAEYQGRRQALNDADRRWREWASLFSGKYFAMLTVYSDETGTGGIPKTGIEPSPGIYGFLANPERWDKFRLEWTKQLNRYKVPYFHFCELNPNERKKPGTTYYGRDDEWTDNFIYDMAIVASGGPVPFGGNVSQKMTVGPHPDKFKMSGMYRKIFYTFFDDFRIVMREQFQEEKEKVSFFFSDLSNDVWIRVLIQVIKDAKHHNSMIGEYSFIDPYSERGIPCQAADLLAFTNRQNSSNMYEEGTIRRLRLLDLILGRHVFPKNHPAYILRTIPDGEWRELVADMRREKKEFELENQKPGKPKPEYFPTLQHGGLRKLFGPNLRYL